MDQRVMKQGSRFTMRGYDVTLPMLFRNVRAPEEVQQALGATTRG